MRPTSVRIVDGTPRLAQAFSVPSVVAPDLHSHCGQCKTDDQGRYPAERTDIKSAQRISRLLKFRRLIAKLLSLRICKAIRPILEPYRQYGLSP